MIEKIKHIVEQVLGDETMYFCVDLFIKPTLNIKIFLDGDNGISIAQCSYFNKKIKALLEEDVYFKNENYSLEVSSPGVDTPLKNVRQYYKNIGRTLAVTLNETPEKIEGTLTHVHADSIELEQLLGKGKKQITQTSTIFFNNIKESIVQIKF
ncbi:MAG: ribosome maturation factor [Alphaproteobacteria bacterium]|nr:ribosome maturation factor [Alphaproteobacteria bacterium]